MVKGRAKLAIGQGVSAWVLDSPTGFGEPEFHSHHAIQITACLEGELTLATTTQALSGTAIAVAADVRHRFEARGLLAFIFVEPESAAGRALASRLFSGRDLAPVDHRGFLAEVESFRGIFDREDTREDMLESAGRALDQLAPIGCVNPPDQRVQRIIAYAAAHIDEPVTLKDASQDVHLSGDRLRHLFVEQTGLAFRTYMLWLRLVRAVHLYAEGATLTEAAHAAGFADSAHFSRMFKRTFGLPATTLTRL